MSDENIKGIPEEETTELQEKVSEETSGETVEETVEEPINEKTEDKIEDSENGETAETDENPEETVEEPEDENETTEKTIDEDKLCPYCGENEKTEDGDYCPECEAAMLSRKIPFLAWIGGLAAVVFSVFALALVFILAAPSIQVAKADNYARESRWYSAYTEYSAVDSVVDELSSILGGESPFVKTGTGVAVKKFDALAHYTSPLEAFYYEGANVEHLEGKFNPIMKDYYEIYNDYMKSYDIIVAELETKFGETTMPEAEEAHKVVEGLRGTEGLSDIWIDFYHLNFAYNFGESDEVVLGYLKAIDENAKKTSLD
jgi:hypothetical protein